MQLLFELGCLQLGRDDAAADDFARRRDLQLDDHLALQARLFAQRPVVEGVDRALVALEDQLDLLDRARGLAAAALLQRTADTVAAAAGAAAARSAAAVAATTAATGDAFDQCGRAAGKAAATGVAAVGRGVDAAGAAGEVGGDQGARRQARLVAGADTDAHAGTDARPGLDVLLQLHGDRCAAHLGQGVLHRQQADAGGLAPRAFDLARRLVRLRVARLGHRRFLGPLLLRRRARIGLGRQRFCGCRPGPGVAAGRFLRRRRRLAFEHQLGQAWRQLGRLGAVFLRSRHQREDEAGQRGRSDDRAQDALEARLVLDGDGPRQHRCAE